MSIRRLCTKSVIAAQLDAPAPEDARAIGPYDDFDGSEPLLVRHVETDTVFEAIVATTPSIASGLYLREPGDELKLWAPLFRPNGHYLLASSTESIERVVAHVRALSHEQLQGILDTWLHASLWQLLRPWDDQRATELKALVRYRYTVGELPVLLRRQREPRLDAPSTEHNGRPILRAR
ncbi:hypothetical protein [Paraburkholderia mimosarum]|nr:hypothetical protein [Paraburkholderia mimosarum]